MTTTHNNGRQRQEYGGLNPTLVAFIEGTDPRAPWKAVGPSLEKMARWIAVHPASAYAALAHQLDRPSLSMARRMVASRAMLNRATTAHQKLDQWFVVAQAIVNLDAIWTPDKTAQRLRLKELDARAETLEGLRAWKRLG